MNTYPIKNYKADGAIDRYRFVKFSDADDKVSAAAAATDAIIGITTELDVTDGEKVDVVHDGLHQVKLGGSVTRGDLLTSDANAAAVAAAPASGANVVVGARALASGVAGDIIPVVICLGEIQGA